MTAVTPPKGNNIVSPPTNGMPDFPTLILGAVVVGTSIYLVSEESPMGGWILTILLLLAIAYAQKNFGGEISNLLAGH